ncbi:MAG: hypothetical protein J6Q73_09015 [Bacteroidaceae bacterium]|nr:hypothetical protein [Bacteroidaceae bacterium]
MRKSLVVLFAALMLLNISAASACNRDGIVYCNTWGNILDKLIALVKGYIQRVDVAVSIEELEALYAALNAEIAEFTDKNAAEIVAFDENVTVDGEKKYKAALEEALRQFRLALEKRATQILL